MELGNFTNVTNTQISNFLNETDVYGSCYRRHVMGRIMGSFITFLIAFMSIMGNSAVVIASFWNETLRAQTGNLLIVYLSSVDIITAIFVMMPSAISVACDYWPFGDKLCKIHAFLNFMFACSSSVNLAVISVDRAIAVVYPFKYRMMTTKVMIRLCGLIFVISFAVGAGCGLPDWSSYNYSEAACAMEYAKSIGVYYVFNASCFVCYYIPVVILSTCNIMIIATARSSGKSVPSLFIRRDKVNSSVKEIVENEMHMKKTIKSLIVVVVTYYICFSPYALCKQVKVHLGIDMSPRFNYITTIFIYIASATNPFIYAILRKDYQDAFKKLPKMLKEKFML